MNQSFGPWSTAIHTGANPRLDTFWKRRLAMLPSLSRSRPNISRSIALSLCLLGAAVLAVPIWKLGAAPPPADPQADAHAGAEVSDGQGPTPSGNAEKQAVALTDQKAASSPEYFPRPNKDEERIIKAIEKATVVEFLDLPLEDCVTFLKEYHDIPIYLDRKAITDAEVKLDSPVTLKLGARLEAVLNLLLASFSLDYLVEDDVLKITTKAQAQKKFFTRTYPVRDLYQEREEREGPPKVSDSLIDVITDTIDPESWSEQSGPGDLRFVKKTESLIIRQTWSVHRKVVQLLRDLREAKRMEAAETK